PPCRSGRGETPDSAREGAAGYAVECGPVPSRRDGEVGRVRVAGDEHVPGRIDRNPKPSVAAPPAEVRRIDHRTPVRIELRDEAVRAQDGPADRVLKGGIEGSRRDREIR